MPHTNSSYRLNTTVFQFIQYHPQTLKMKSYQKVSPMSEMVGVMVPSIFMLRHKASSPYNFNIQFPCTMYTKFITHVYDVNLNTSMHQCCVISIAPLTGQRNSVKHHPIYDINCLFFSPYHTLQDDMQLKGKRTLQQDLCPSIIKAQLTTNLFEEFLTCSPFSFYVDCREFF